MKTTKQQIKEAEKQEIQSKILNGRITKEEGVERLKILSCSIAMKSGVKYNMEICK